MFTGPVLPLEILFRLFFIGPHGHRTSSTCSRSPPPSTMMSSSSSQQQQQQALQQQRTSSRRNDPNHIAPFLTHVVTHHGQTTLIPPQNAGRIRKGGKSKNPEKQKPERRRESDEPRFNTAAPINSRGVSRRANLASDRVPRPPPALPPRFSRGAFYSYAHISSITICYFFFMSAPQVF